MKANSTLIFSVLLLLTMIGAGSVSAYIGYAVGDESLQGVTYPDINPAKTPKGKSKADEERKGLTLVSERSVIVNNYDSIHGKKSKPAAEKPKEQAPKPEQTQEKPKSEGFIKKAQEEEKTSVKFPLKSSDKAVMLQVTATEKKDGALLLKVNLTNDGDKAIRFLYSFLDVRDEKGNALSAIADGLPQELPANGQSYPGVVRIPTALLNDAQKLSLALTDYPEQKLQLKIADIPVVK